jgi:hypothetical protein
MNNDKVFSLLANLPLHFDSLSERETLLGIVKTLSQEERASLLTLLDSERASSECNMRRWEDILAAVTQSALPEPDTHSGNTQDC